MEARGKGGLGAHQAVCGQSVVSRPDQDCVKRVSEALEARKWERRKVGIQAKLRTGRNARLGARFGNAADTWSTQSDVRTVVAQDGPPRGF
jgi:hypothetical protein